MAKDKEWVRPKVKKRVKKEKKDEPNRVEDTTLLRMGKKFADWIGSDKKKVNRR